MKVTEQKGLKCPECQNLFLESNHQTQCNKCKVNTEPAPYFVIERINRERLVFIGILSIIPALIVPAIAQFPQIVSGKFGSALLNFAGGFGIIFIGLSIFLISAFAAGHVFFQMGGFLKDRIISDKNELEMSKLQFSWHKVFKDFIKLIWILILGGITTGIVYFIKSR